MNLLNKSRFTCAQNQIKYLIIKINRCAAYNFNNKHCMTKKVMTAISAEIKKIVGTVAQIRQVKVPPAVIFTFNCILYCIYTYIV